MTSIEASADLATLAGHAIELTPAIRPPTSEDGRVRIVVYLELPERAQLDIVQRDGAPSIDLPAGARASRVEALGAEDGDRAAWRVLDVRETTFGDAREERFRLLRPGRGGGLTGISWPRSDDGARQASRAITSLFEGDRLEGPSDLHARRDAAARLVRLNDCASCHVPWRAEDRRPGALVQRRTDGQGLYLLAAVMSDSGPFERYRPRNASTDDPFTHVRCDDVDVPRRTVVCADGQRPAGWLDLRAALAAGDPHARRVCASRRALVDRMTPAARSAFTAPLEACATR
ncbi:MAG TPA: hypothetical protein VLT33_08830 [Labilithrix sp.]|nr:hypothetical protein [Labilithrix sp.]